jgi:hypothetical protein
MPSNKPSKAITFRPTQDTLAALEILLEHYRKEFTGVTQSAIINKAIVTLAVQVEKK